MAEPLLTIALEGTIRLHEFSTAVTRFRLFISALTAEVGARGKVTWLIDDLQAGSATATVRGSSRRPQLADQVVEAFGVAGEALEQHRPLPFSDRVRRRAYGIQQLVKGSILAVRLETPFSDALLTNGQHDEIDTLSPLPLEEYRPRGLTHAYGQILGRIQTLTNRGGLRFTLYDPIFDKPIACYLHEGQEDTMRGVWGRKVTVKGLISREPYQKRAVVIRNITDISVLDENIPGSYRQARGVVPVEEDEKKPEDVIRSLRDAWSTPAGLLGQ
jgi:hypothetical protein